MLLYFHFFLSPSLPRTATAASLAFFRRHPPRGRTAFTGLRRVDATENDDGRNVKANTVVVRVKRFTNFRKKKEVVLRLREELGPNYQIINVQDVTNLPHNGCRLPKKRRK
ncbi:hypothetical protein MKX03_016223 [Papaver bracteatum]|nr:hypothetical protein MKX03_016223 [Papaver bracteatum]